MHKLKYLAAILIAVAGLGLQQAQAHLLPPTQFTTPSPIGSPSNELAFLQDNGFLPATSQFLFKKDNNGNTDGNFGSFFTVSISGNTATISWNLTGSGFTLDGVLIKDGASNPPGDNSQLYRFYGVSADEKLVGSGTVTFDNPIKNISHVSFFGSPGGGQGVPDGGATVMLLGAGLGSLGMARRFLKR